ncbi:hypothetical protein KKC32_01275 [Patescibacteria group bacterium]|nr:hypothetical protein [Patescibacteria group bacterium]
MIPFYRVILKRALNISWKNKWLWILGFFAAFLGNSTVYEALLRSLNNLSENKSIFSVFKEYGQLGIIGLLSWNNLKVLWQSDPTSFGISLFVILAFLSTVALLICASIISQGGLIRSSILLDSGVKVKFKDAFSAGIKYFWRILGVNFITKIIFFGILLLFAYLVSLLSFNNQVVSLLIYIFAMIIFVVLGIIIYFLTVYGTAFVVLRDKKVVVALKEAWHVFSRHVVLNMEMGLILFVINILAACAFFIGAFIALAPSIILYVIFIFAGFAAGVKAMAIIILIVFLTLLVLLGAWYYSFQVSAWSILFEELALRGGKSKILRVYEQLKGKLPKRKLPANLDKR